MNYNDQSRTSRQRVLNNCSRCERQRSSCGCQENAENAHHTHHDSDTNCGCSNQTTRELRSAAPTTICTTTPVAEGCVDTYPVAMAYVPMQQWRELYDPASGLSRGTIFRELDLEWYPTNCRKDCRRSNS